MTAAFAEGTAAARRERRILLPAKQGRESHPIYNGRVAFPSLDAQTTNSVVTRLVALGAVPREPTGPGSSEWLKAIRVQCLWKKHRLATDREKANMDEAAELCGRLATELETARWGRGERRVRLRG